MIGRTLAHYEVMEKLGEGGMGVIYKARDTHLDRFVAIKVLPADKLADEPRRRRFVQEAKAASALNHPNIITVHDISEEDGTHFIAMEWVEGKTLSQLIAGKRLHLGEAFRHAIQMADALSAAHGKGIIHRDLKPGNVMVTPTGLVKVLDFGLAKLTEARATASDAPSRGTTETQAEPLTEEGVIVGTVAYMSPEQAEGKAVDARSDIFSFGAVLYEMVTGRSAFERGSRLATLSAILCEDPRPPRELTGDTPPELERVINRCLRKDPARRFQNMSDVKVALEELSDESGSGALARAASPARRRRLAWIAGGLVLALAAGISAWFGLLRQPAPLPMIKESAVTSLGTEPWGPALSPDGKQVAFVWDGVKQDNQDVYVQLVGDATPRRLTSDPAAEYSPVWSPDALHIAFLRQTEAGTDVVIIPAAGGTERRVHSSTVRCSYAIKSLRRQFCGIAWSPDGRYLAVVDKESPRAPNSIFLLDIVSLEKKKLTSPPAGSADGLSAFAPDGRTLAFARTPGGFPSDIYSLVIPGSDQAAGEPRRITHDRNFIMGFDWSADGRSIVFTSARGGVTALWRVAASGGEPERLPVGGNNALLPSVSRQGKRLAYHQSGVDWNIWRAALPGSGISGDAGAPARLIYSREEDYQPAFSPDGKRIAFSSRRSGNFEIWTCSFDGSSPVRLTNLSGGLGDPSWSPDGRQLAFYGADGGAPGGQHHIQLVGAEGGAPRRLTTGDFQEMRPAWSHDSKWVYFSSDRGTGMQVWKAPAGGGGPVQVTRKGGFRPMESVDGNSVYYWRDGSLWKIAAEGGDETPVLKIGARVFWEVSKSGIYLLDFNAKTAPAIECFRFDTRARALVLSLPGNPADYFWEVGSFAISPDERWILYEHRDRREAEIMLVENFR